MGNSPGAPRPRGGRRWCVRWIDAELNSICGKIHAPAIKFDANKLYASEILAILMQSEPENVVRLSNLSGMDGVDMLLQVIAYYKRRVPSGLEEEECVENLFNALCAVMNDNNANREKFCKSEGFELMLRCMRERKHAAPCALRALDFATIDSPANCERLVEVL